VFDVVSFSLSDMVECASGMRRAASGCTSVEEAAQRIVTYLRSSFLDPQNHRQSLVLARMFVSSQWDELSPDLQDICRKQLPDEVDPAPDMRCLVLAGSDGQLAQWQHPTRSTNHRVIPLPDVDDIRQAPVIAALVRQLGLPEELAVHAGDGQAPPPDDFGVFHVREARGSPDVPDQEFVAKHRIRSVLGFGGVLPAGRVFAVVLVSRTPVSLETAELFRDIALSTPLALLQHLAADPEVRAQETAVLRQLLELHEATVRDQALRLEAILVQRRRQDARLIEEAATVETLREIGTKLAAEMELDQVMQLAVDAATRVTGARYGAFFCTIDELSGERATRYAVSGLARSKFERLPMPRVTGIFGRIFNGEGVMRADDITRHPAYGQNPPFNGLPPDHPPVRSFLAVPVLSQAGEVLGGFFFGHPDVGLFDERDERLAVGVAAPTAIALDNARLYHQQRGWAEELQRALMPRPVEVDGLQIASRYLPGAGHGQVGGDWFDVIPLPCGRTAFVVGDVMGKGIPAAATMGQLRAAVRAYAVMDLPPVDIMRNLNELAGGLPGQQFVTCVYAVYDPVSRTLGYANAGHLPPAVVTPERDVWLLEDQLGLPLGLEGAVFKEREIVLPRGAGFLLYTDGLVETRQRSISEGVELLVRQLAHDEGDLEATCDELVETVAAGQRDDDVTLLYVREIADEPVLQASMRLAGQASGAADARRFVRATLLAWGMGQRGDSVVLVADELLTNAIKHAATDIELRLCRLAGRLVVEVRDEDARLPRLAVAARYDERHRGLLIVQRLASRWGVRPIGSGKVVWAEIDDAPTPGSPVGSISAGVVV
jgi:anti-sigma regulatory factor (Ser/Thr protein kinase)